MSIGTISNVEDYILQTADKLVLHAASISSTFVAAAASVLVTVLARIVKAAVFLLLNLHIFNFVTLRWRANLFILDHGVAAAI